MQHQLIGQKWIPAGVQAYFIHSLLLGHSLSNSCDQSMEKTKWGLDEDPEKNRAQALKWGVHSFVTLTRYIYK